ncbi:MAG: biotin synthase BioB [Bacteroidales bacterium]|nr:biotin synthase BioB [Bacteroidales bacterium]
MDMIRNDWTIEEIGTIYHTPLLELIAYAANIHRRYHSYREIELSTLISIKTGGCPEDCAYCAQSARYATHVDEPQEMSKEEIIARAKELKSKGIPRVCLSAAWRQLPPNKFDEILEVIRIIKNMGMKVCLTMGKISADQAKQLAEVGITAYNHNIDTSENFYPKIITTRTFKSRLETIYRLIEAGIPHCCGGIIGLGESEKDRISMIHTLATLPKHPFTIPINALMPIEGTPLEQNKPVSTWELVRVIATVRVVMPTTHIELAAGRIQLNDEAQALCFMAGANAIFVGDKLLTAPNPSENNDIRLLNLLGVKQPYADKMNLKVIDI